MAVRQYIGARYVAKVYVNSLDASSADWESGVAYEPLTMVTYNSSSYISRKDVPASVGNPVDNPSYWAVTGLYNGQISNLQNQIDALDGRITFLEDDLKYAEQKIITATGDGVKTYSELFDELYGSTATYIGTLTDPVIKFISLDDAARGVHATASLLNHSSMPSEIVGTYTEISSDGTHLINETIRLKTSGSTYYISTDGSISTLNETVVPSGRTIYLVMDIYY